MKPWIAAALAAMAAGAALLICRAGNVGRRPGDGEGGGTDGESDDRGR